MTLCICKRFIEHVDASDKIQDSGGSHVKSRAFSLTSVA